MQTTQNWSICSAWHIFSKGINYKTQCKKRACFKAKIFSISWFYMILFIKVIVIQKWHNLGEIIKTTFYGLFHPITINRTAFKHQKGHKSTMKDYNSFVWETEWKSSHYSLKMFISNVQFMNRSFLSQIFSISWVIW